MKKAGFLLGLLLLFGLTIQCTEDDEMDAHIAKANQYQSYSGEEGDQDTDSDRD